jgi:23S rRNA (adenine2503-C2)-methyltransferase
MDLGAVAVFLQRRGQPGYRARQLFQWIYEKGAQSFEEMTNLPKDLRTWLQENATFGGMTVREVVGPPEETQKIVFRTDDGETVESVLMREEEIENETGEEDGEPAAPGSTPAARKVSLCVSSQVGCPLACTFCMTGYGGFRRNLRVDEILDQVIAAQRLIAPDERIANLVFMGMGEPMLNLEAVVPAVRLLVSSQAFGFATRRVTVSTAGVIPGIEEFARAATEANLAVSLNATTQETRDRLMPSCGRWPLDRLVEACRRYPLTKRRRITFEYVLLVGVNDTAEDQRRLVRLVGGIPCKINLILYNRADCLDYEPTPEDQAEAFRAALAAVNLTASLRRSKGARYQAACGQLAAHFLARQAKKEE